MRKYLFTYFFYYLFHRARTELRNEYRMANSHKLERLQQVYQVVTTQAETKFYIDRLRIGILQ